MMFLVIINSKIGQFEELVNWVIGELVDWLIGIFITKRHKKHKRDKKNWPKKLFLAALSVVKGAKDNKLSIPFEPVFCQD